MIANEDGQNITISGGFLPSFDRIVINEREDIDVTATGVLNIEAGTYVYLGSEEDLNVELIDAGGAVRLKTGQTL